MLCFGHGAFRRLSNIYVAWEDYSNLFNSGFDRDIFIRTNLSSAGWQDLQVVSEPVQGSNTSLNASKRVDLAVENGNIYLVWEDTNDFFNCMGDSDIFYRCFLFGGGWADIQVISENVTGKNFNNDASLFTELVVENGNIYVVWQDSSDWDNLEKDDDIFYRCNLSGSNWEDIQIISEPTLTQSRMITPGNTNPSIAVDGGKCHVVWEYFNTSSWAGYNIDVAYRCTFLPPNLISPGVTPSIGNTRTKFNFTVIYSDMDNEPPMAMVLNISNNEYLMLESDPADMNYRNGKSYYYNTSLDIGNSYTYFFRCSDGYYNRATTPVNEPEVLNTPPEIVTVDIETAL